MWKKALIAAGLSLLLACGGSGPKPGTRVLRNAGGDLDSYGPKNANCLADPGG